MSSHPLNYSEEISEMVSLEATSLPSLEVLRAIVHAAIFYVLPLLVYVARGTDKKLSTRDNNVTES